MVQTSADIAVRPGARSDFLRGLSDSIPVVVAVAPFSLLFGVLAVDNGFLVFEAVLMSLTVFAGASQMVGIELFGHHVAPWLIVVSIFAVNFRHVLYSAALGRRIGDWPAIAKAVGFFFLVDPQFAESERRAAQGKPVTFSWYMGLGLSTYVFWVAGSWLGAVSGGLIPDTQALGIDFLLPIYFLGLVLSFRDRPLFVPIVAVSAVVSILAYETIGSPWHVSAGAVAGVVVAVIMPGKSGEEEAR